MEKLQAILSVIYPLLMLTFAVGMLFWMRSERLRSDAAGEGDIDQKALFLAHAETWLRGALPALITKVENEWLCPDSGRLKKSAVKAELLKITPPELIATIGEARLNNMIEMALGGVRELWDELPGVLFKNQITEHNEQVGPSDDNGAVTVDAAALYDSISTLTATDPQGDAVEVDDRCLPPEESAAIFEKLKEELCPVGHHWEPVGTGFVAVLDAPGEVDAETLPAEDALAVAPGEEAAPAEDADAE